MSETSGIVTNLVIQVVVAGALLVFFECCRGVKPLYLRKCTVWPDRSPAAPAPGPFAWVRAVLAVSEEDALRIAGLDGYVLLRFMRACLNIFTFAGVLGVIILVPVYHSGEEDLGDVARTTMSNLKNGSGALWAALVMAYVFTLYALYVFGCEYEIFYQLRQRFLRNGAVDAPLQVYYTIMVERIPDRLRTDKALADWFESMFPGQVHGAVMCIPSRELIALYQERAQVVDDLEHQNAALEATGERPLVRPKMCHEKVDGIEHFTERLQELNQQIFTLQQGIYGHLRRLEEEGVAGQKKESFLDKLDSDIRKNWYWPAAPKEEHLSEEQPDLVNVNSDNGDAILEEQKQGAKQFDEVELGEGEGEEPPARISTTESQHGQQPLRWSDCRGSKDALTGEMWLSGTGFVTFKSQLACVEATQLKLSEDTLNLLITPSPDPLDMIWKNVSAPTDRANTVRFGVDTLLSFGILFWGAVLAFVAAVAQPEQIAAVIPPFENVKGTLVWDLFAGPIPVYLLMIFIALVPTIIRSMAISVEQQKSRMGVEQYVMQWFFGYQLANLLISLIAGSLWDVLGDAIDDPMSVFDLLAESLPASATFFLNFVIAQAFVSNILAVINIGGLVFFWINYKFRSAKAITRRELYNGIFADQDIVYGDELPNLLLIVLIGFAYWTIAPLVLLPCIAFFYIGYIVYKYRLMYIVTTRPQTGGKFWYSNYRHAMIALLVSNLILLAFLGLKRSPVAAPLVVPLPILVGYHWHMTEKKFRESSQHITRKKALLNDQIRSSSVSAGFDMQQYRQPFLRTEPVQPEPYISMANEAGKLDTSDQHYCPRDVVV